METKTEIKSFIMDFTCPKCNKGKMRPKGNVILSTYPLTYPHKCDDCGHQMMFEKTYPYKVTE